MHLERRKIVINSLFKFVISISVNKHHDFSLSVLEQMC